MAKHDAKWFVERMEELGFTVYAGVSADGKPQGWYWGSQDGIRLTDDVMECLTWLNANPNSAARDASVRAFLLASGRTYVFSAAA